MSGKGSGRRPQQVPDETVQDAWSKIFGNKKKAEKSASNQLEDKKDDHTNSSKRNGQA